MSVMELKLERYIEAQRNVSFVDSLDTNLPVVVRAQDPETGKTVAVVCSVIEPTEIILPMNVIWLCFDKRSPMYNQAFRRTSKTQDPVYSHLKNSWELLYFYADVFIEQFYDPADLVDVETEPVGPATTTDLGIVSLNYPPLSATSPRIISVGHESLTNNRDPNAHTHPEVPATILAQFVDEEPVSLPIINQPNPELNMALCYGVDGFQWRKLTESDLEVING